MQGFIIVPNEQVTMCRPGTGPWVIYETEQDAICTAMVMPEKLYDIVRVSLVYDEVEFNVYAQGQGE